MDEQALLYAATVVVLVGTLVVVGVTLWRRRGRD